MKFYICKHCGNIIAYVRKPLAPGQKPEAVFMLAEGDSVVAAYEYCNLHSLWKA